MPYMPLIKLPAPLPDDTRRCWLPMTWLQGSKLPSTSDDDALDAWFSKQEGFCLVLTNFLTQQVKDHTPKIVKLDGCPWHELPGRVEAVIERGQILITNSPAVLDLVPLNQKFLVKSVLISPDGYHFFTPTKECAEECMRMWDRGYQHVTEVFTSMGLMEMPHPSHFLP